MSVSKIKVISFLIIGLFIGLAVIPGMSGFQIKSIMPDDELDQSQTYGCSSWSCGMFTQNFAQSFVPTKNVLTRVEILGMYRFEPDYLQISIRKEKNGPDLTSLKINPFKDVEEWYWIWVEFDFEDIVVIPGEKYYIVWTPGQYLFWWYGDNNPYEKGEPWRYSPSDYWEEWEDASEEFGEPKIDFCFKTYGYNDSNAHEDLSCQGNLIWNNATAGSLVRGSFTLQNVGFQGSCLDWELAEYPPDWGIWEFSQVNGEDLTPADGTQTIFVAVTVPEEKDKSFNGEIKVVNTNDPDDYEILKVYLTTPKSKYYFSIFDNRYYHLIKFFSDSNNENPIREIYLLSYLNNYYGAMTGFRL